jgi:hypothetical protein
MGPEGWQAGSTLLNQQPSHRPARTFIQAFGSRSPAAPPLSAPAPLRWGASTLV